MLRNTLNPANMPAAKTHSPWIALCLKLYKTGRYPSYTHAMKAASKQWEKCEPLKPRAKKACQTRVVKGPAKGPAKKKRRVAKK